MSRLEKTNNRFNVLRCTKSQISDTSLLPINNGYLYFIKDTNEFYFDDTTRHLLGNVEIVNSVTSLSSISVDKLYYDKSDNCLKRRVGNNWELASSRKEIEIGMNAPSNNDIEIFIDESIDPITIEVYSKNEINTSLEEINEKIDEKILVGDGVGYLKIDETATSSVEVYTREQVDALFNKLKQLNPTLNWN